MAGITVLHVACRMSMVCYPHAVSSVGSAVFAPVINSPDCNTVVPCKYHQRLLRATSHSKLMRRRCWNVMDFVRCCFIFKEFSWSVRNQTIPFIQSEKALLQVSVVLASH